MENSHLVPDDSNKPPVYVLTPESSKKTLPVDVDSERKTIQDADQSKDQTQKRWEKLFFKRRQFSKRQSSDGYLIGITGTGTILEESLDRERCFGGEKEVGGEIELVPGVAQYEDYHTIDWQRDLARDRFRHKYIKKKMREDTESLIKGYYDTCSGWICVFLIGLCAGGIALFINIGEEWMKDLKIGICLHAFYLNREQCCWSSNTTFHDGDTACLEWYGWADVVVEKLSDKQAYLLSYGVYVLWSLFFGVLASCLVKTMAPYACGSGIPEIKTILSGFIIAGYLGKMTLLIKSVGIMLAVSAGLSIGMEGPLVHIVCCVGNVISYCFPKYRRNEAKKREILSAASAAGVSVAFNAPIGGVLFSLEEVSYYFPLKTLWRSFFCALVAAFVLRSISPSGSDQPVKYYMTDTRSWILIELIPFVLLGILGGLIGSAFIRGNITWWKFKRRTSIGKYPITEVLVITLLTALIKYPNEFTRVTASDLIKILFTHCGLEEVSILCDYERNTTSLDDHMDIVNIGRGIHNSIFLLSLALLSTYLLTVFTYGIKVPSGLFVPSLAMGAIIGRIVGIGIQALVLSSPDSWIFQSACSQSKDCFSPDLYAMLGAAACLAGVTRMTVSLVVIMFELTGRVDYIVPLMATVMTSKWVADALCQEGIYEAHIHLGQFPFLKYKGVFKYSCMTGDLSCIRKGRGALKSFSQEGMTLEEIEHTLNTTGHHGFPVILSQATPHLVGFVLRRDAMLTIEHLKKSVKGIMKWSEVYFIKTAVTRELPAPVFLHKIVDMAPITVTVQTPIETVIDIFCKLGLRQILITENGTIVDIITKKDILSHLQEHKDKGFSQ